MHRPHSPTVRQLPPIKRLLAGALIAGAVAAAAASPASAANSTCFFDAPFHRVRIFDNSGPNLKLHIIRIGNGIAIRDTLNNDEIEFCASGSTSATVNNTDTIFVNTPGDNPDTGGVSLNMEQGPLGPGFLAEPDGHPEIEVQVRVTEAIVHNPPLRSNLEVIGTPQADTIRVGNGSSINIGPDSDTDIKIVKLSDFSELKAPRITVEGRGSNDVISGRGATATPSATPSESKLFFTGGLGNDKLLDGLGREDKLFGGFDQDFLNVADGINGDEVTGGAGMDIATIDQRDRFNTDTEQINGGPGIPFIGKLALAPKVVRAQPGKVARVAMSWTHPTAWKALRAVEWRVLDGGQRVGLVRVKPRSGKLAAHGAIKLVRGKVGHEGRTVTARLAVRVPKALVGRKLRVDVQATDGEGRTQLARRAGLVRVAR